MLAKECHKNAIEHFRTTPREIGQHTSMCQPLHATVGPGMGEFALAKLNQHKDGEGGEKVGGRSYGEGMMFPGTGREQGQDPEFVPDPNVFFPQAGWSIPGCLDLYCRWHKSGTNLSRPVGTVVAILRVKREK